MKLKLYCLVVYFVVIPVCSSFAGKTDAMVAWGGQGKNGIYTISFSQRSDGIWSEPFLISATSYPKILPAIGSDSRGNIWLAWVELHGLNGRILWSYFSDGTWSSPDELDTSTESVLAPSIAVDASDEAWLVFSGTRKGVDDIFVTHWTGSDWAIPVSVNKKDQWPDILPVLEIDSSGKPIVLWQGYNGHQYVQYQSQWNGVEWSAEEQRRPAPEQVVKEKSFSAYRVDQCIKELPAFIQDRSQAVFHSTFGQRKTVKFHIR